jgi:hypothetical protein
MQTLAQYSRNHGVLLAMMGVNGDYLPEEELDKTVKYLDVIIGETI